MHYLTHYSKANFGEVGIPPTSKQYSLLYYPGAKGIHSYPRMFINNREAPFTDEDMDIMADYQFTYLSMPVSNFEKVVIKHMIAPVKMKLTADPITNLGIVTTNQLDQGPDRIGKAEDMSTMSDLGDVYIMYLTLKPGVLLPKENDKITISKSGYAQARVFYAPKFEAGNVKSDLRTTIHWEPNVTTNDNGEASITYYNADPKTSIRIAIEGISDNGIPLAGVHTYQVR